MLYLPTEHVRLHLNAFRREPAISEFDWHFTPIHSSSTPFSTDMGSGLHEVLPRFTLTMGRSLGFGSAASD